MRVCFRSSVDPRYLAEYRKAHAAVWPEILRALKESGWENYSLHLGDDGLLIGIVDCDDFDEIRARMAILEINTRWQAEMAKLFPPSTERPDQGFVVLEEVFNLEKQLATETENNVP